MADYIYLLEHRLSVAQRDALSAVRAVARTRGLTLFLVGGAVRDLTSGSPVRDLDVVVLGNALKLKKELEKAGASVEGEYEPLQSLFVRFAGQVRMEIGSTLAITYPKPGKPVARPATILEDLRRRDFTANAMALSLNEGSYGLLMDPLNGVADIENRELRLVSNYGFIEDPVRMIRATRLMARLGWALEERTQTRYQNGLNEGYLTALNDFQAGYEVEEIFHEEDPLRVLKRLETEGWMKFLAPFWSSSKVSVPELERLREAHTQLQVHGIFPDPSSSNFPLLTAKLSAKEISSLKAMFPRRGFAIEIEAMDAQAKELASQLLGKQSVSPSQSWRLLNASRPETLMQLLFSNKNAALQAKLKSFLGEWPQVRQKISLPLLQEMRITPDLPGYADLLENLFYELMDGRLGTAEEMKAYLEPHSPPAPPPPVSVRRPRQSKPVARPTKSRSRKSRADAGGAEDLDLTEDTEDVAMPEAKEEEDLLETLLVATDDDDDADIESDTLEQDSEDDAEDDVPDEKPQVVAAKPARKTAAPARPVEKSGNAEPELDVRKKVGAKAPAKKSVAMPRGGEKSEKAGKTAEKSKVTSAPPSIKEPAKPAPSAKNPAKKVRAGEVAEETPAVTKNAKLPIESKSDKASSISAKSAAKKLAPPKPASRRKA